MSTKIYEAYRIVDVDSPYDLLWSIKKRGQAELVRRFKTLYDDVMNGHSQKEFERRARVDEAFARWVLTQGADPSKLSAHDAVAFFLRWEREEAPPELTKPLCKLAVAVEDIRKEISSDRGGPLSIFEFERWVRKKYRDQDMSPHRNEWCFDAFVNVRVHGGYYYLTPHCDKINLFGNFLDFVASDSRLKDYSYWDNSDSPENVSRQAWKVRGRVWNEILKDDRNYLTLDIVSQDAWVDISVALHEEGD